MSRTEELANIADFLKGLAVAAARRRADHDFHRLNALREEVDALLMSAEGRSKGDAPSPASGWM